MKNFCTDTLKLALKASKEVIWEWHAVGQAKQHLYYSESNLAFLGATSQASPNLFTHPEKWIHQEDLFKFNEQLEKVKEPNGSEFLAIDCRHLLKEGTYIWLRIRGASVRNETGELLRLAGSIIDISLRKKAEIELEEERHLLKMFIESVPLQVYFKDLDSKFVMANTAMANRIGEKKAEDILGKCDHDFFDACHADRSLEIEHTIMQTQVPQEEEIERESIKGADDLWVLTSKRPWINHKGSVKGTFGVSHDVTNLVKTQQELMRTTSQLKAQNQSIQEELQLANEVQLAMIQVDQIKSLPQELGESGWRADFSYHYTPISGLSGDFYQVIPLGENKAGVFICDVMGHGVRAALIVSMLRGLMEKERVSAASPDSFLHALNQGLVSILQRAQVTMFATVFYGVIDLENQILTYSNAGHPSPLVVNEGTVNRLSDLKKVSGPALGIFDGHHYELGQVSIAHIDQMLLYTDGIYEAENADQEEFGVERVIAAIESTHLPIEKTLDSLVESIRQFADHGKFTDDICILGVQLSKGTIED